MGSQKKKMCLNDVLADTPLKYLEVLRWEVTDEKPTNLQGESRSYLQPIRGPELVFIDEDGVIDKQVHLKYQSLDAKAILVSRELLGEFELPAYGVFQFYE